MANEKNHLHKTVILGVIVLILLLAAQFIPSYTMFGFSTKKINILSDLSVKNKNSEQDDDQHYADSLQRVRDSLQLIHQKAMLASIEDSVRQVRIDSVKRASLARMDSLGKSVVAIEDYSVGGDALAHFFKTLNKRKGMNRPVRVAFLGDSFIEGDIIVADVREQLQNKYGGRGIGFVPMASAVATYTPSVHHTFKNWKSYSIIQKKDGEERFMPQGVTFAPLSGATAQFEGVKWKPNLDSYSRARLLYVNNGTGRVGVQINGRDTIWQNLSAKGTVDQIVSKGDIRRIAYSFDATGDTRILGVVLEDSTGVSVDNYSVRGNSGLWMHRVNKPLSNQLDKLMHYDLVVLQYGVNVVESNVLSYGAYRQSMVKVINHLKSCMPRASFLVLSIGDRSTQQDGEFVTMPGVHGMIKAQKQIAQECGVAFWNMFDAMGGENSMVRYVENNWASKDYTHISHAGGRRIANALMKALMLEADKYEAIYQIENNQTVDEN